MQNQRSYEFDDNQKILKQIYDFFLIQIPVFTFLLFHFGT